MDFRVSKIEPRVVRVYLSAMPVFARFAVTVSLWSALCAGILSETKVAPAAVFAVWLFGFVWITGYIIAGKAHADHMTKRWLQMLAGVAIIGGALYLFLS